MHQKRNYSWQRQRVLCSLMHPVQLWCTVLCSQCAELLVWRSDRAMALSSAPSSIETTVPALLLWIFALTDFGCNSQSWFVHILRSVPQNCEKRLLASTCQSVCPSVRSTVRIEHTGFNKTHFHQIWYLNIFEELLRKLTFDENLTRTTGALHEDLCIFIIISRLIILRMRNASDKSRR